MIERIADSPFRGRTTRPWERTIATLAAEGDLEFPAHARAWKDRQLLAGRFLIGDQRADDRDVVIVADKVAAVIDVEHIEEDAQFAVGQRDTPRGTQIEPVVVGQAQAVNGAV